MKVQKQYPDYIIIHRLGDFYEVMGENAKILANELELTLTGRDMKLKERVPMIGFPYHMSEVYINKITKNHNVAIMENEEIIIKTKQIEENPLISFFGSENYKDEECCRDTDDTPLYLNYSKGYLILGTKDNSSFINKYKIKYDSSIDFMENYYKLFNSISNNQQKEESSLDKFNKIKENYPNYLILIKNQNYYESYENQLEIPKHLNSILQKEKELMKLAINEHIDLNLMLLTFEFNLAILEENILSIIPKANSKEKKYKINFTTGEYLQ